MGSEIAGDARTGSRAYFAVGEVDGHEQVYGEKEIQVTLFSRRVKMSALMAAVVSVLVFSCFLSLLTDDEKDRPSLNAVQQELAIKGLHLPTVIQKDAGNAEKNGMEQEPAHHVEVPATKLPQLKRTEEEEEANSKPTEQDEKESNEPARFFEIRIPPGAATGQELEAEVPGHGMQRFVVPEGAVAGQLVQIRV
mmetsp:Transcript_45688/g.93464  ORF Transcript_45688/g.93464 Transcript_45688/m.93464 type:complete len:194 (+) Transcript_45688:87-668(+)